MQQSVYDDDEFAAKWVILEFQAIHENTLAPWYHPLVHLD